MKHSLTHLKKQFSDTPFQRPQPNKIAYFIAGFHLLKTCLAYYNGIGWLSKAKKGPNTFFI